MPISSLIVRMKAEKVESVLKGLAGMETTSVHETRGENVIIVTQTETKEQDKEIWESIERLDGVIQTDLIYHNFEDLEAAK